MTTIFVGEKIEIQKLSLCLDFGLMATGFYGDENSLAGIDVYNTRLSLPKMDTIFLNVPKNMSRNKIVKVDVQELEENYKKGEKIG